MRRSMPAMYLECTLDIVGMKKYRFLQVGDLTKVGLFPIVGR